ncbi:serine protease inhibitor 42Dd [Drosophila bipectinata]|uniref:serine protease inhibitor 42Dd n=1 Tax=Drosophila bipectinata TaxID=42026 RepID=UPI001C894024|nr:serine protease inhibitor 42Dd [Drosophila bipectinata]
MSEVPNSTIPAHDSKLGAEIFHSISSSFADQNVVISPLLLEATLALLYLGSDGATAEELQKLLRLKERFPSNAKMANFFASELANITGDPDTRIQLRNHLLVQPSAGAGSGIAEDFQKIAQTYFHATAESIDLEQTEKLRRHITEQILSAVGGGSWQQLQVEGSPLAKILLLLAANLQSKWFLPFSAYRTGLYEFHSGSNPEQAKSVAMLFDDDMFVKFAELRDLNARAIELPYEHAEELSMLLILPNQRDGLPELEKQLRSQDLGELQQRMQMEGVQVLLPKFSIDFECSLRQPLKQLGFEQIFSASADFKHLHPTGSLPVADVLQKLRINLNESGSGSEQPRVAAEYKPIVISNSSRQKFFRADHPFFFAIRSENVTYLMGHVVGF